jgi:hypothetical protein
MDILEMNSSALCWTVVGLGGTGSLPRRRAETTPFRQHARDDCWAYRRAKNSLADPSSKIASTAITAPHPRHDGQRHRLFAPASRFDAIDPGQLVNWSTEIRAFVSRSATTYFTTSAVWGAFTCRVPTAANSTRLIKPQAASWALDTSSGEQPIGNMILADTLGFVITNKAIYAIPTSGTHTPVWSAVAGGRHGADVRRPADRDRPSAGLRRSSRARRLETAITRLIAIIWRLAGSLHASSRWVSDGIGVCVRLI